MSFCGAARRAPLYRVSPRAYTGVARARVSEALPREACHQRRHDSLQDPAAVSSTALRQHRVGLEEIDDGIWSLHFCNVLLGRIDERKALVKDNWVLPMFPVNSVTYVPGCSPVALFRVFLMNSASASGVRESLRIESLEHPKAIVSRAVLPELEFSFDPIDWHFEGDDGSCQLFVKVPARSSIRHGFARAPSCLATRARRAAAVKSPSSRASGFP